jgi:hypothetical protein
MAHANLDEVLSALRNVDFPATKDELLRAAQASGASSEVLRALRAIPPEEYASREEVTRSVPVDPVSDRGLSSGQRGQQARLRGKPGLSQHLREVPKPAVEEGLEQSDPGRADRHP